MTTIQTTITAQKEFKTLKSKICAITGMSEQQHCDMQFEVAFEYLAYYLPDLDRDHWVSCLTASPVFWAWWVKNWEARDEQFINDDSQDYTALHDPYTLSRTCKVHGRILNASYVLMTQDLIKEEVSCD